MAAKNTGRVRELFGLETDNQVSLLELKGIIPKPRGGVYHLGDCTRGYIKHIQQQHTVLQAKYDKITANRWVVSTKDCADFFGVGVHAINLDIRDNNAVGRIEKNKIRLPDYVRWKIERAAEVKQGRPRDADAQALELTFQKTRYATVQADIAERDSVTLNNATDALHGLAGIVIGALTAQRGRLAGILAPITDPAHVSAKLREEEVSLRDQIANKIREFAGIGADGGGDDSAAPEPISGRMDSGKQGSAER